MVNPTPHPLSASSAGYWVASANGSVYSVKGAPYYGNALGKVHGIVVGIGATHSGDGYYLLDNSGRHLPVRRRQVVRVGCRETFERADHRIGRDAERTRLLVARSRRRCVQFRRRALLRFDGQRAFERADHLDGADDNRSRLLAACRRRRCVQLRRRQVPRFDRQHAPQLAGHLDGDRTVGRGLLVGRERRRHLQRSTFRSTAACPDRACAARRKESRFARR